MTIHFDILLLIFAIDGFYASIFFSDFCEISFSDTITSSRVILSANLYKVIHVFLWRSD